MFSLAISSVRLLWFTRSISTNQNWNSVRKRGAMKYESSPAWVCNAQIKNDKIFLTRPKIYEIRTSHFKFARIPTKHTNCWDMSEDAGGNERKQAGSINGARRGRALSTQCVAVLLYDVEFIHEEWFSFDCLHAIAHYRAIVASTISWFPYQQTASMNVNNWQVKFALLDGN